MNECRHGLSEDCPGCMQETIDALAAALRDCLESGFIPGSSSDKAWKEGCDLRIAAAKEAFSLPAQRGAAPEGYVLVPRKLTIAMIAAGWAAFRRDKPPVQLLGPGKGFVEAWDAMLADAMLAAAVIPADGGGK